ncbi:MAG: hypothetical protein AAFR36_32395 [Bacteroidota bacterium]
MGVLSLPLILPADIREFDFDPFVLDTGKFYRKKLLAYLNRGTRKNDPECSALHSRVKSKSPDTHVLMSTKPTGRQLISGYPGFSFEGISQTAQSEDSPDCLFATPITFSHEANKNTATRDMTHIGINHANHSEKDIVFVLPVYDERIAQKTAWSILQQYQSMGLTLDFSDSGKFEEEIRSRYQRFFSTRHRNNQPDLKLFRPKSASAKLFSNRNARDEGVEYFHQIGESVRIFEQSRPLSSVIGRQLPETSEDVARLLGAFAAGFSSGSAA